MSTSQSFATLIERIQPSQTEVDAAKQHLATIQTRLETVFEVSNCRVTGSFARDSSIHGFSDTDLLAVFRKSNFTWGDKLISSSRALEIVRQQLLARYPNSAVGRNVMAITIAFSDGQQVDVVPAMFESMYDGKWPIYMIPDGADGWMQSCPSLYDAYIAQANTQSGGKLRYVAQLIKFWRECRTPRIPLSSFHIEMVLASEEVCKGVKEYSECIRDILRSLTNRGCRAIRDPYGIAGNVPAVKTANQQEMALATVTNSRDHANSAVANELWDTTEA
jgi:predicted nucleotidyltransferase